ncbi:MAG TPA: penicillin-binding transpeptidase domain-containing protein [Sedimentisphaerales bacterium]|nr:penicillin-binding transpeptidase domain-containing protein [Sedimentisphaerales bacterium]
MYSKRVKVFVIFSTMLLAVCVARLAQMQLLSASSVQEKIAELKRLRGQSTQLKTIRGRILDRNGRVLATDEARFWVHINYTLGSFLDERVRQNLLDAAASQTDSDKAIEQTKEQINDKLEDLARIINKCAAFKAADPSQITAEIQRINDIVWDNRVFQAWRRAFPNSDVFDKYPDPSGIPLSVAVADFEAREPDPAKRHELASKVDILEMRRDWPLVELQTDDDIFAAQLEFIDTEGVRILPREHRLYPYGTAAAHTIGWVGPARREQDKEPFEQDRLLSYLDGEVCGREDGVEYVCEGALRGRRGEWVRDIDRELVSETDTEPGDDVTLTLDIELQRRIEDYLAHYPHDPNCGPGMSAVVVEVGTSDILALVSLPVYDLNRVRYDYGELVADPRKPLINRAINSDQYPAGSVVKPLILIAGLETGAIAADEVISCPPQAAPDGWPNCWIFRRYSGVGHDNQWTNTARNAIKGSCNIYFSRLADRIDPLALQQWLFKFGYGRDVLDVRFTIDDLGEPIENRKLVPSGADGSKIENRNFRQFSGTISSTSPRGDILSFDDVPPLWPRERRMFGIGQGSLRVTPLQVANAMAALARGGVYMPPQLFSSIDRPSRDEGRDLGIRLETLAVIYDGMSAVVNEVSGTAYTQFQPFLATLAAEDVKVYGKTGSTEKPEHAWFAGFAQDSTARKIAIAVIVEGGQHGSSDAAPLARDIIQFCIEAGYLGKELPIAN